MSDDEKAAAAIIMVEKIYHHKRAMRKKFNQRLDSINSCTIQPHIRQHIYQELTGDTSREISRADIDQRVRLAIDTYDPDLIIN